MIRFFFITALSVLGLSGFSQSAARINPELKQGSVIVFEVNAQGQAFPLTLTVSSIGTDGVTFEYDFAGSMQGKFVNSKVNLEKGKGLNWDQPQPGEERRLPDDQTIAMVSATFLADLKKNKKSSYDGMELMQKDVPKGTELIVSGQELDAVYAETADGAVKYWILNNDQYPVILKIEGHPSGVSLACRDFKAP